VFSRREPWKVLSMTQEDSLVVVITVVGSCNNTGVPGYSASTCHTELRMCVGIHMSMDPSQGCYKPARRMNGPVIGEDGIF
jgi:hypothetical protein